MKGREKIKRVRKSMGGARGMGGEGEVGRVAGGVG